MIGSEPSRVFVLRGPEQARLLHQFLKSNAKTMADQGQPLEVRVSVWKPKATDEQRSLIWVINEQIAQQAWVAGRCFDAETWHEQMKRELLPEQTSRGVQKWRVLSNGERLLGMSTENLNRAEKSDYIDALLARAADLGVEVRIEQPDGRE
ncbi:MAG: hypothetical protein RL299_936 [Pseudomonadota bacterium]